MIILFGISMLCFRAYIQSPLKIHYWPALGFKIICGILLGMLFHFHYRGGDTLLYYERADDLARLGTAEFLSAISEATSPSDPVRAIYFIRLVAVIRWLTGADYWLLSVYFSLFSFLGAIYLSAKLVIWKNELLLPACVAFLYFPSAILWSSGLLKESLVFGAMAFLLGTYFSWHKHKRLDAEQVVTVIISTTVLTILKYYIAAVLIPALIYLIIYHLPFWEKRRIFGFWPKTCRSALVLLLPTLVFFALLSPNLNYDALWPVMQLNHMQYIRLAPDGAIYTLVWFDNWLDVFINIPYLWFTGIFRPLLGEDFSFPALLSSLENTILFIGFLISIYGLKRKRISFSPELLALLIYVGVLSIFLSYSAPNFGTLARFKIYYMPFVLLMLTYQVKSINILNNK